jgi:hypothetical protein
MTPPSPPRPGMWNWDGEAMSSSPWGGALGKGDGDVATPVRAGQCHDALLSHR